MPENIEVRIECEIEAASENITTIVRLGSMRNIVNPELYPKLHAYMQRRWRWADHPREPWYMDSVTDEQEF